MTAFIGGLLKTSPVGVYADDVVSLSDRVSSFEMSDGASVRKVSPQGLRFSATIDKSQYDALGSAYSGSEIKMGMMIAPLDLVKDKGEFVLSNTELTEGSDYLVVQRKVWATPVDSDSADVYRFNAVLSTLKESNYDRNFVARAFITIGSETAYASSFDPIGRNAVYVALASKGHGESGEQLDKYIATLQSYVDPVLSVPENVTLFVGETKKIKATVNGLEVYPSLSVTGGQTGVTVSYNSLKGVIAGSYAVTAFVNDGIDTVSASINVTVTENPVLKNGTYLSYDSEVADFVLNVPADRDIKILQLTDTQIIDVTSPSASRLSASEIAKWADVKRNVFDYMDEAVEKANPDFIVITGDMIYGEFDPNAEMLQSLIEKMDSYGVYWSIAMGNHDLESECGLDVMLGKYENSTYCLYANHSDKGFSNYNIEIRQNGEFKKMLYMLDTNDTYNPQHSDPVPKIAGLTSEQLNWFEENVKLMKETYGENAESMTFVHVPFGAVVRAFAQYGYSAEDFAEIDHIEDSSSRQNGDFGCIHTKASLWNSGKDERFWNLLKSANTDGIFLGHCHNINASVLYDGIRITFGLKTGTFDEFVEGELGGTLITVNKDSLDMSVEHLYTDLYQMDSHSEGYENQPLVFGNQVKGDILTDVSAGNAKRTLSVTDDADYIPENGSGKYLLVDVDCTSGQYMGFGFKFKNVEAGEICFSVDSRFIPVGESSSLSSVYYWLKDKDGNTINDKKIKGSVSMGYISVTETFAEVQEEVTLFIQVQSDVATTAYKASFDNALCAKCPTAKYGYGEDYSDATIFNQVVYGTATTYVVNGSESSSVFDMSVITSGADLPDGATSALKVVKQATGHHYTWISVAMGSVANGEKYAFSFDFKGIDATNIDSKHMALTSSLDPAKGSANKINDVKTFVDGRTWFEYEFTQDYDNVVLWMQIAGKNWGDGYSFSISNVKATKYSYGYSENFENATVYGSTVCGDITVYTKNAGDGVYTATLTSDATELPEGVNKGMKIEKSALSGHTYTYVNFVFGSVKQGETYTFGFNSKVVSASDGFNMCYMLSSSKTTDKTAVEGFSTTVALNNGGAVSFEWTADKDYDNIAIWVQISNSTWDSGTYSVTFGNVKCIKKA